MIERRGEARCAACGPMATGNPWTIPWSLTSTVDCGAGDPNLMFWIYERADGSIEASCPSWQSLMQYVPLAER
jgi:hypothetical protein